MRAWLSPLLGMLLADDPRLPRCREPPQAGEPHLGVAHIPRLIRKGCKVHAVLLQSRKPWSSVQSFWRNLWRPSLRQHSQTTFRVSPTPTWATQSRREWFFSLLFLQKFKHILSIGMPEFKKNPFLKAWIFFFESNWRAILTVATINLAFNMCQILLSAFYPLAHLILRTIFWGRYYISFILELWGTQLRKVK